VSNLHRFASTLGNRFTCSVVCKQFYKAFSGRVFIAREETFACAIRLPKLIGLASTFNTLVIGYSDSVLSVSAVLIHGRASIGFELLWAFRHNFILIYFRVFQLFRDISIIRLGEPIVFNLISLMDMLSASFSMHNSDTKDPNFVS